MDTRNKIVSEATALELLAAGGLRLVQAELDPLLSETASALEALQSPLLLQVRSRQNEYFSPDARAALAAALRCVRYVVTSDSHLGDGVDLRPLEAQWRTGLEAKVSATAKVL